MKILWGISGSFCSMNAMLVEIKRMAQKKYEMDFVLSDHAYTLDTRFQTSQQLKNDLCVYTKRDLMHTLPAVEKISLQNDYDVMVLCPCTANSLAKLVHGIYDNALLLACKTMLRNQKPVVIGYASNDGLGIGAMNLAMALQNKHLYFIPFCQDDVIRKPNSLVSRWDLLEKTMERALMEEQLQPLLARNEDV